MPTVIRGQEQYTSGRKEIDMRKHIVIDKVTGIVENIIQWGDNRDLPCDYPFAENQKVVTINEFVEVDLGNAYDTTTGLFYVLEPADPIIVPSEIELLKDRLAFLENAMNI